MHICSKKENISNPEFLQHFVYSYRYVCTSYFKWLDITKIPKSKFTIDIAPHSIPGIAGYSDGT